MPAPGTPLGGWSRETSEPTFGQWVSGLARLSSVLGDQDLASKAVDYVEGYAATLPASGKTGMGIYGWEKLVCGLVDAAVYGGYAPALKLLSKIIRADTFDETRRIPTGNDFARAGPAFTPEWYTLPENLYRGFLASGDEALTEFAQRWHYDVYWDPLPPAQRTASHGRYPSGCMPTATSTPWRAPGLSTTCTTTPGTSRSSATPMTGWWRPSATPQAATVPASSRCPLMAPSGGPWNGAMTPQRSSAGRGRCSSCAPSWSTGEARYLRWAENILYNGLDAAPPSARTEVPPTTPTTGSGGRANCRTGSSGHAALGRTCKLSRTSPISSTRFPATASPCRCSSAPPSPGRPATRP